MRSFSMPNPDRAFDRSSLTGKYVELSFLPRQRNLSFLPRQGN